MIFAAILISFYPMTVRAEEYADAKSVSQNETETESETKTECADESQDEIQDEIESENTDDGVLAFVTRMYEVVLNRNGEEDGIKYWSDKLKKHTDDGAALARGFILSKEFTDRNLSNEAYLNVLYLAFFDREGDEEGFNEWKRKLEGGISRTEVLAGFVNSKEFSILCERFGIVRGTMESNGNSYYNDGIYAFVERMYLKALKRERDPEGIEYWTYLINADKITPLGCAEGFFNSEEFVSKNLSNEDYVETLYETFFDRPSDEGGKSYWIERLRSGTSRDEVLRGFAGSKEFKILLSKYGVYFENGIEIPLSYGQPFNKGTLGSDYFRIPSIVSLDDGTIIASADCRWNSHRDGGGADGAVAISKDNGLNWSAKLVNYFGDNGNEYNRSSTAFLDGTLATDGKTVYLLTDLFPSGFAFDDNANSIFPKRAKGFDSAGNLMLKKRGDNTYLYYLRDGFIRDGRGNAVPGYSVNGDLYLFGPKGVSSIFYMDEGEFTVVPTEYLVLRRSTDGGKSWSDAKLLNVKDQNEQGFSVGSTKGTVLSDGTVIFPCYRIKDWGEQACFIYSSDNGETWKRSPDASAGEEHFTSEGAIIELDAEHLRMFYRDKYSTVGYTDYVKVNGDWRVDKKGYIKNLVKGMFCQINVIKYNEDTVLISYPGSGTEDRNSGKIATVKLDDGFNMRVTHICNVNGNDYFGYSGITKLNDGSVGLLYESYVGNEACDIRFLRIAAEDLGM